MTRGRVGLRTLLALLGFGVIADGCLIEGEYLPDLPPPSDPLAVSKDPPRCGDGVKQENEQCDDGNPKDGDGCASTCTVEPCFTCKEPVPGAASVCGPQCDAEKGELCVAGACVTCTDGAKNGDETDVDCGGRCGPCGIGQGCGGGNDCGSAFCAGGVCCNEPCDGVCVTCQAEGSVGICSYVAENQPDDLNSCSVTNVCDGKGACKKMSGQPCDKGIECVSGKCISSLCE